MMQIVATKAGIKETREWEAILTHWGEYEGEATRQIEDEAGAGRSRAELPPSGRRRDTEVCGQKLRKYHDNSLELRAEEVVSQRVEPYIKGVTYAFDSASGGRGREHTVSRPTDACAQATHL
jgi:hypothetical protein